MLLRVEIGRFTSSPPDYRTARHKPLRDGNELVSVPLILTSRWTGVTRYAALWSPDFPLCNRCGTATVWLASPLHFTLEDRGRSTCRAGTQMNTDNRTDEHRQPCMSFET